MRAAASAALVAFVLLAAGCEDSGQVSARHAVGRVAHPSGRVDCTSGRTGHFGSGPTATVFICVVHAHARCDRYIASRHGGRFTVRVQARRTDCTLPAS
jgi:hypothetical protein